MSYCFRKETYPQYTKRINEITRGKYSDIFTDKFVGDALSSELVPYIQGKKNINNEEELAMKSIIMSYMASKIAEKNDGIKRSYPDKIELANKIVNCEPYQGNYNQVIKAINDNYREEKVVSEGQPAKQPEVVLPTLSINELYLNWNNVNNIKQGKGTKSFILKSKSKNIKAGDIIEITRNNSSVLVKLTKDPYIPKELTFPNPPHPEKGDIWKGHYEGKSNVILKYEDGGKLYAYAYENGSIYKREDRPNSEWVKISDKLDFKKEEYNDFFKKDNSKYVKELYDFEKGFEDGFEYWRAKDLIKSGDYYILEYELYKDVQTNETDKSNQVAESVPAQTIEQQPISMETSNATQQQAQSQEQNREEKVVSEGQPVKQPDTINIYAGTGENANLSNFAERPFTLTSFIVEGSHVDFFHNDTVEPALERISNILIRSNLAMVGAENRMVKSVENLFQALKVLYADDSYFEELYGDSEYRLSEKGKKLFLDILNSTPSEARKKGKSVEGLYPKSWDEESPIIMKSLIKESFKQNPEALKELLATGNATLTHTQDKGKWGKEFPRLLMEVREELGKEASKTVEQHEEIVSDLGGGEEAKSEVKDAVKVAKEGISFEDALKGQEAIFTKEEQAQIKKALNGKNLKVMSVSRKTDPAFFSKEIVKFLEENSKKPFTDPTRVNAIEIWSKHDGMPIQDILDACKKYKVAPMMSFSITGLGGTSLEGGVMKYNDLLDRIEKLAKSGSLNPLTTTVRIDPILVGVTNMDDIRNIVERAKGIGVKKFVTSLVQSYGYLDETPGDRKVTSGISNALAKDGKSYDWDEYYGRYTQEEYDEYVKLNNQYQKEHNVDYNTARTELKKLGHEPVYKNVIGKIKFKPKQQYINQIGNVLLELDKDPNITIQTCAFGIEGLKTSACLDPLIIERLTGLDIMSKDGKYDRDTSRPECMCYGAHGDFFAYQNKKCYSSCAYCYAAHSGDNALNYYDENGNLKVGGKIDYYTNVRTNESQTQQPQKAEGKMTYSYKNEKRDGDYNDAENEKYNTITADKLNNTVIYSNYKATDGLFQNNEKLTRSNFANCEAVVLFSNSSKEKQAHINTIYKINEGRPDDKKVVLLINPSSDAIKKAVYNYNSIGMIEGRGGKGRTLDNLYTNVSIQQTQAKINNAEFIENSDMILYQRKIQHFYNQAKKIAREIHADFFLETEEGEAEVMRAVYNAIKRESNETDNDFAKEKLAKLVNNWDHVLSVINVEETDPDIDEYDPETEDPLYVEQHTTSNMPKDKILRGLLSSFPTGKVDELGTPIYYDSMVINNILVNTITGSKDSDEMMDRLIKGMRKNPFFDTIVKNIETDKSGRLRSMLFTKYANLYMSEYFTVSGDRVIDENSTFSTTSINLGIVSNVDEERFVFSDKYRSEIINLNDITGLFENAGDIEDIKRSEPANYMKWKSEGYTDEQILVEKGVVPFYSQQNLDKMTELLKTIGIELDKDEHNLNKLEKEELITLRNLIYNIHNFRSKIENDNFNVNEWKKRNSGKTGWYSQILKILNGISQQKTESMVKAEGESKFLFADKNYIDGMMDGIHKDRENYMKNEFLKYEYFTSNISDDYTQAASGIYSSLIKKLALDNDTSWFKLKHFFIDKSKEGSPTQYKDLTPDELKSINQKLFWKEEFANGQRRQNGEDELCYVHAPIYADSGSLHYYCVPKVDINAKKVKSGDRESYAKPDIIKDIENLILLETNRIAQCKKRAELIREGKLAPVSVYDTVVETDKEGNEKVKKGNGEKYVFLPLLNDLDAFDLIKNANSQVERDRLIREFASRIFSLVFTSDVAYKKLLPNIDHIDVDSLSDKEKFIYNMNKPIVENASENEIMALLSRSETSEKQKKIIRDLVYNETSFIGNVEKAIKLGDWEAYQNFIGKLYEIQFEQEDKKSENEDDDEDVESLEDEEDELDFGEPKFIPTFGHELQRVLTSYIRTADIEQLTITDPALYKNDVDKQKRYKQVQAGYNRPDTKSKYGKEWMSSIILKDNEISLPEGELKVMRDYLTERAKKDGINLNVDEIISVFKKINVADAQAWRTLKSYRSVRDMYGHWTQKDEDLYQKIIHEEKLTKDDYDVVWQTLKPFVYTQHDTEWTTVEHDETLDKDIEVTHYTKVGDQYKDSEANMYNAYLLMSIINSGESFETEVEEVYEDSYFETNDGGMINASILDTELEAFELDVKTSNVLNNNGIETLGDLIENNSKLFKLGKGVYNRLNSLVESLGIKGLSLGTNIEEFRKNSTKKEQKTTSVKKIADRVLTKLGQINKFMDDYDIDTVMFQSAVKVGQQGVIDLNKIADNDVYSYLEEKTGVKGTKTNKSGKTSDPEVVHEIPYSEWGIKMSTPPHMYDTKQQLGSQLKKLVPGDIPNEAKIKIDLGVFYSIKSGDGKKSIKLNDDESIEVDEDPELGTYLNKENFLKLYHALMSDMIMDNYKGVQEVFGDREKLAKALQELMGSSPKYDYDIKQALLYKNGKFVVDPRNPLIKDKLVALMSSVLKNRINKQMTRGGTAIQMTVWGGNDLHIERNPDGSIAYMECYMPAYSKSFVEAYMNENGILDVNKCKDNNLLRALCYRVPTEDIYSMIPLKIKGFMPMQFGTNIALPKEITALTGSDFDVDKMYMYLPEMRMETEFKKDRKEALKEFKKSDEYLIMTKYEINEAIKREIEDREENGEKPLEAETTSDGTEINKLPEEDEDKIRKEIFNNNFMAYSIEKGYAKSMPKFIKFDSKKPVSKNNYKQKANLLLSMMMSCISSPHNITKAQNPGGFEYLKKLAAKINPEVNRPMSLTEKQYLNFFNLNMTGKQLIGIYANNNVAHSLCQGTGLQLNVPFWLNGQKYQSLSRITDTDNKRISRNIAEFLAASVDNAKDPVLAKLWQNKYTASTTCFLLRLGVPVETLMTTYKDLMSKYPEDFMKFMEKGPGAFKAKSSKYNPNTALTSEIVNYYDFENKTNVMTSNFFGFLGAYAQTISNMETLNGLLKCDSTNGAMYDLADIADKQIKLNKLRNDSMLSGLQNVLPDYKEDEDILSKDKDEIMKDLQEYHNQNSGTNKIVKSYQVAYYLTYVNYKRYYSEIIDPNMMNEIVSLGTQLDRFGTKDIKEFITEYTKQQLRQLDDFQPTLKEVDGKFVVETTNDKIKKLLKEVPEKLEIYKKRYPNNMFIKMLSRFDTKNGSYLIMRKISEMRAETVNEVKSDFNKMYSSGFLGSKDAKELIAYSLCINGFGYSPLSFISMIPLKSLAQIKGMENVYNYFEIDNIEEFEDNFIMEHNLGEKVTNDKKKLLAYDGGIFEYPSTSRILTYTKFGKKSPHNFKKIRERENGKSLYMEVGDKATFNKDLYDIIDENLNNQDIIDAMANPGISDDDKKKLADDRENLVKSIVEDVVKVYNKEGLNVSEATKEEIAKLMSGKTKMGRYYSLNNNPLDNYSPIAIDWCN